MARLATGYLAEDGTFFTTESACRYYEASQSLYRKLVQSLSKQNFDLSTEQLQAIFDVGMNFIRENLDDLNTIVSIAIAENMPDTEPSCEPVPNFSGEHTESDPPEEPGTVDVKI